MSDEKQENKTSHSEPTSVHHPHHEETDTMSIVALVASFIMPPAGLALGIVANAELKKKQVQNRSLAVASIIISSILTGLMVLFLIFFFIVWGIVLHTFTHTVDNNIQQAQKQSDVETQQVNSTSNAFMRALQNKDYSSAYLLLDEDARVAAGSVDAFQKTLVGKDIKSYTLDTPKKVPSSDPRPTPSYSGEPVNTMHMHHSPSEYDVSGTIVYTDGKAGTVQLTLGGNSPAPNATNFTISYYSFIKD